MSKWAVAIHWWNKELEENPWFGPVALVGMALVMTLLTMVFS